MGVTANLGVLARGRDGKERFVGFRLAPPVKLGKGVENLQPAHEENQQGDGIDPVGEAGDAVMSVNERLHG